LDTTIDDNKIDHIVCACGSGGTAAGIALGLSLAYHENSSNIAGDMPSIHAVGVCDNPEYFYGTIASIAKEMGLDTTDIGDTSIEGFIRDRMIIHQGRGLGYASSTAEELDFIVKFSLETGISLDPVYSGKALFHFMKEIMANPESYRNSRIVFWHTGGTLGNYEKVEALSAALQSISPVRRMDVYGRKK